MELGLTDKVVIVTGGGSGIGQAISRLLLEEGARVGVVSRTSDHVLTFISEMTRRGATCELFEADLSDAEQCRQAAEVLAEIVAS